MGQAMLCFLNLFVGVGFLLQRTNNVIVCCILRDNNALHKILSNNTSFTRILNILLSPLNTLFNAISLRHNDLHRICKHQLDFAVNGVRVLRINYKRTNPVHIHETGSERFAPIVRSLVDLSYAIKLRVEVRNNFRWNQLTTTLLKYIDRIC